LRRVYWSEPEEEQVRLTVAIGLCVLGGLVLTVGAFARESSITWKGSTECTSRNHFCHERRATVRLVLSGSLATATFEGYSAASHDAESTRATCTMKYRLFTTKGGWSYYHQAGKVGFGPSGPAFNSGCQVKYGALRMASAGTKLRADFGLWSPGRDVRNDALFWPEGMVRGYLTRG
jgi:hypothetical protein